MLLGEHEHTIDDKNRLTLPARFRTAFASGVVLTRGMDGCLYAYRRDDWETLVESRLAELDPLSQEGAACSGSSSRRDRGRARQAGARDDPAALIQHGGLGADVVVAGVRDHLEIWDRAAWRKELNEVEGSAEDVAERLATKRD
jgi:MraZ protein